MVFFFFFFSTFCHKGDVICIPEVIDISPGNLDSSCASSSPAFLIMYFACKLNKQGDNIKPLCTSFPNWKGVCQGCILSPCLFNFYAEYIMQNARLDEAQLESKLMGETLITSDMQILPPL